MMESFRNLLLQVWQETSRHIEIQEATTNLAAMLAEQLPLAAVLVRRLDANHLGLITVATAQLAGPNWSLAPTSELSAANYKKLVAWGKSGQVLHQSRREQPREMPLVLPQPIDSEVLAAPLGEKNQPRGALLLIAAPGGHFDVSHRRLIEALREPITVALENDHRLHELATLREAAEADRRSLLNRLGRQTLGDAIVGAESGLRPVMERIELVAARDVPVLILGETGTGKEVVSRAIHARSSRHAAPFIRVNCGAIPAELIDSQLFGHEKGSFTGASEMRQGWFERADGGTLFLDEIGELPLAAQVRLLRVLQDGFLERVGGSQPIRADVRIVAATHRDLASMVQTKEFREDLWYRLAVFPIMLPPLRERLDDIPALAHHFAERASTRFGLPPVPPTESDLALLRSYAWPGNIRELGAVMDRAAILGEGKTIEVAKALGVTSPPPMPPTRAPVAAAAPNAPVTAAAYTAPVSYPPTPSSQIVTLDEAMRQHIERALQATHGRIEGARGTAAVLGINPHTLRARMRKLKIDWSAFRT